MRKSKKWREYDKAMERIFIPVLLGTARDGRQSEAVARFVHAAFAKEEGLETVLVDIRDHLRERTLPPWGKGGADERPTPWKELMTRSDGLLIVTPEYNFGVPGELKLLLDSLFDDYRRKPIGIVGVSNGPWGGQRMLQQMRQVIHGVGAVPLRVSVPTPFADKLFDAHGAVTDEKYKDRLTPLFEELLWFARALKAARNLKLKT